MALSLRVGGSRRESAGVGNCIFSGSDFVNSGARHSVRITLWNFSDFSESKNCAWTLESGHSIRRPSIPPVSSRGSKRAGLQKAGFGERALVPFFGIQEYQQSSFLLALQGKTYWRKRRYRGTSAKTILLRTPEKCQPIERQRASEQLKGELSVPRPSRVTFV